MGRPMDDAELARKVADMVADLPPLTDDQVARVARLLAPYATERTNAMPTIRDTATVRPASPSTASNAAAALVPPASPARSPRTSSRSTPR